MTDQHKARVDTYKVFVNFDKALNLSPLLVPLPGLLAILYNVGTNLLEMGWQNRYMSGGPLCQGK